MSKYEVKSVVSDYGLYVNGELALICNHRANARLIKAIMEKDDCHPRDYAFRVEDYQRFLRDSHDIHPDMCNLSCIYEQPRQIDGKCEGYCTQSGDETAEICKVCDKYMGYEEEEEQNDVDPSTLYVMVTADNARRIKHCINSYKEIRCGVCGATYEDDDKAFLQETGMCQYCHSNVYTLYVRSQVHPESLMDKCRRAMRIIKESKYRGKAKVEDIMRLYQQFTKKGEK